MKVIDRHGNFCPVSFDAIKERIWRLVSNHMDVSEIEPHIDIDKIAIQTIGGMYDGITTRELDELSARLCASMQSVHYLYDSIAACIVCSNMAKCVAHKMRKAGYEHISFSKKMDYLIKHGGVEMHPRFMDFVRSHSDALDNMIVEERNVQCHGYFAFKTLERSYLLHAHDDMTPVESPQDMWLRVAVMVNICSEKNNKNPIEILSRIKSCYDGMSTGKYTHATPTLFNAGTNHPQCSSCYLLGTDDSMDGIWTTIKNSAMISKWAGGLGVHISNVRAKGARIRSTNGISDGIIPMLRCYNDMVRYCNQAGKRKGSLAAYLEPWHADVWEFVELRRNTGSELERARDIFIALWVPDEFMHRVESDGDWYLMSPDECPGLVDAVGKEFTDLYNTYIDNKQYVRRMSARTLWHHIVSCQLETGTPYILYKDHVNRKCNQSNIGTIRSSNLCAEITEYSDSGNYAVCNLASIAINAFVRIAQDTDLESGLKGRPFIDHEALHATAKEVTRNLNNLIDISMYPVPETRDNNLMLRPIGIGVQGLGDVYCMFSLPYESQDAIALDREIMETIYHGAMEMSLELAIENGSAYKGFEGSPLAQGLFQFDLWGYDPSKNGHNRYDWGLMRERVMKHGVMNSLLTALMPTASTSQILGNCECFEPFQSNVYKRTTLAGEFIVINKHLVRKLMEIGMWDADMRNCIMQSNGSVQSISKIPYHVRQVFKTVWELPQRSIIDHAVARGPFVCQSQSMNLFITKPSFVRLSSALMYGWKMGLKTGMYYLRSNAAAEATRVVSEVELTDLDIKNIESERSNQHKSHKSQNMVCNDDICVSCSS